MEHLLTVLTSSLSSDAREREGAEQSLLNAEAMPGFGPALCAIMANAALDIHQRQLAAITLRKFACKHWCIHSSDFVAPLVSDEDKHQIRILLANPVMMRCEDTKVLTAISLAIASIAEYDLPLSQWDELLVSLIQNMKSSDTLLVCGAVSCLVLLVEEIHVEHLPGIMHEIWPVLQHIVRQASMYPDNVRVKALRIFRSIVDSVIVDDDNAIIKSSVVSSLPAWTQSLQFVLSSCFQSKLSLLTTTNTDTLHARNIFTLEIEACQTVSAVVRALAREVIAWMPSLLQTVWAYVTALIPYYQRYVVDTTSLLATYHGDECGQTDGGGGVIELLHHCIDVISTVTSSRHRDTKLLLKPMLTHISSALVILSQMTPAHTQYWSDCPCNFWLDEDDNGEYSLRNNANNALVCMFDAYDSNSAMAIWNAIISSSDDNHERSYTKLEAAMFSVGACATAMATSNDKYRDSRIDVAIALKLVWRAPYSEHVFVRLRTLIVVGQLSDYLTSSVLDECCKISMDAINSAHLLLRVAASRTFALLCSSHIKNDVFHPCFTHVISCICETISRCVNNDECICLVLESLERVLNNVCVDIKKNTQHTVVPLLLMLSSHVYKDRLLMTSLLDVLAMYASQSECITLLRQQCTQLIVNILSTSSQSEPTAIECSIDILSHLVSPFPFSQQSLQTFLPLLIQALLQTSDVGVQISATRCLAKFVRLASRDISSLSVNNVCIVNGILQCILHTINQTVQEDSIKYAAILTIRVLEGINLDNSFISAIIRALLNRLSSCNSPTLTVYIFLVFAKLAHSYGQSFLNTLASLSSSSSSSSSSSLSSSSSSSTTSAAVNAAVTQPLELLMQRWIVVADDLQLRPFSTKATVFALAKILLLQDSRINALHVRGYAIVDTSAPRRTRSAKQSCDVRYSIIPLPSKILSILAQAWHHDTVQTDSIVEQVLSGEDSDDVDENIDLSDVLSSNTMSLSALAFMDDDTNTVEREFDDDAINTIDTSNFIAHVILTLVHHHSSFWSACVQHLNDADINIVECIKLIDVNTLTHHIYQ